MNINHKCWVCCKLLQLRKRTRRHAKTCGARCRKILSRLKKAKDVTLQDLPASDPGMVNHAK